MPRLPLSAVLSGKAARSNQKGLKREYDPILRLPLDETVVDSWSRQATVGQTFVPPTPVVIGEREDVYVPRERVVAATAAQYSTIGQT